MKDQQKYSRNCPRCDKEIIYSNKYSLSSANKQRSNCKQCATKESSNRPEVKQARRERFTGENNPMYGKTGKLNPFYGKTHSEETRKVLSLSSKEAIKKLKSDPEKFQSFKEKISKSSLGRKSPLYGRTFYEVWEEKYGAKIASQKERRWKAKISKKSSGENNPMFGKPSPQGSGNGWKGWYKGTFFRSLRELMFLMNYIERFGFTWESLEKKEYRIPYVDYRGQTRNYFGDYLLNGKYFVEIKPIRLQKSPSNLLKKKAAEKRCEEKGWIYKEVDPKIHADLIKKELTLGNINFQTGYEKKFNDYQEVKQKV